MSLIESVTLSPIALETVTGGTLANPSSLPALPRPQLPQLPSPQPSPTIPLGPFCPDPPVRKDIA